MLSLWLVHAIPPPTWGELAEAVEPTDQTIAHKIRRTDIIIIMILLLLLHSFFHLHVVCVAYYLFQICNNYIEIVHLHRLVL